MMRLFASAQSTRTAHKQRHTLTERLVLGLLAVVIASVALGTALAAPAPRANLSLKQATEAVKRASSGTGYVKSVFPGPDGLTGAVTANHQNGLENIAWITPHGKAVFIQGTLVGPNGKNYTKEAMYATGLLEKPSVVRKKLLSSGMPIHVGSAGPTIVAIVDPNCIFCHLLHKAITPLVKAGKVQVDYILVGIIKPDSFAKASSILQAKDPAKALDFDETHFDRKQEEGGYPVDKILRARYETVVQNNAAAMRKLGSTGTPTLLYCDKNGQVQMQAGMPQQADAFVAGLGSCKE